MREVICCATAFFLSLDIGTLEAAYDVMLFLSMLQDQVSLA